MLKIYVVNIFYDIKDFFKRNKVKFIIAAVLILFALILAIRNALAVRDLGSYILIKNGNILSIIVIEKSGMKYFWMRLFMMIAFAALIYGLSFHYISSFLNFIWIFVYTYLLIYYFVIYIIIFKLTMLPLFLLCLLPCFLITLTLLTWLVVIGINRGLEIKHCGLYAHVNAVGFLRTIAPILILLGVMVLIESVFGNILAIGLSL